MTFLAEMNNKQDMKFWNIKINRVILPTHVLRALSPVAFSREQRVYRPNLKYFLNWGALPPSTPF